MSEIFKTLDGLLRTRIISGPTPIEHLDDLSDQLGIDLWTKALSNGGCVSFSFIRAALLHNLRIKMRWKWINFIDGVSAA